MSLGTSANDVGLVIILLLLAVFVPIALLVFSAFIGRILGIQTGAFPLVVPFLIGFGAIVGISLYLDSAGRAIEGRVFSKDERVQLRRQGDWSYTFSAAVRYRLDGITPARQSLNYDDSFTTLKLSAAQFDTLREGDTPALKVLPLWGTITLVRLGTISTREWIPWNWLGIGLGVVAIGWLTFKLGRSKSGCLVILAVALLVGVVAPTLVIYRQWQAMENLAAKPLRASATVREVTRVTAIDPLPCNSRCSDSWDTEFDVPQQYDIVEMNFTPGGGRDSVLAVDAADVGSAHVQTGSTVEIAYAPGDPRSAQIIGATHSHHWKNMIAFVGISVGTLLVLLALALVWEWFSSHMKRKLANLRPVK